MLDKNLILWRLQISEKHNNLLGIIDIGVGFLQYYEFTNKSILLRPQLLGRNINYVPNVNFKTVFCVLRAKLILIPVAILLLYLCFSSLLLQL